MKITVKKPNQSMLCRAVSLCLFVVILLGFASYFPVRVSAEEPKTAAITLYHWQKVYTQDDLQSGKIMIFWGGSNGCTYYSWGFSTGIRWVFRGIPWPFHYIDGEETSSVSPSICPEAGGFYTTGCSGAWELRLNNWCDSANGNAKTGRIYLGKAGRSIGWTGEDLEYEDPIDLTLVTTDVNCGHARKLSAGRIMIFHYDRGGKDEYLGPGDDSGTLEMWESRTEFTDLSLFTCTEETWQVIQYNLTVHTGTTLRLEDKYMLDKGCTITVEPGAVLSVDGEFMCNGNINNYGTIVFEENAYVHPSQLGLNTSDPSSYVTDYSVDGATTQEYIANQITCYGSDNILNGEPARGNIIVLNGAYVEIGDRLFLREGTSLVNNGTVVCGVLWLYQAQLVQNANGLLYCGYQPVSNHGRHEAFTPITETKNDLTVRWVNSSLMKQMYISLGIFDCSAKSVIRAEGCTYIHGGAILNDSEKSFYYVVNTR